MFEDLKKHGGQIKEKYVIRDVVVPFLSALSYLHGKVSHGVWVCVGVVVFVRVRACACARVFVRFLISI